MEPAREKKKTYSAKSVNQAGRRERARKEYVVVQDV